ncbi:MAG TPA: DUF3788 family protein [Terriglobales bacterium]|nr:DUF3788 family protein [Terriglobales bacterium]
MALSALADRKRKPTEQDLRGVLGTADPLWRDLKRRLQDDHGPLEEEWSFAGETYGWSLRMKEKKRNLVYLTPGRGCFLAGLALGAKAVEAARRAAALPRSVLDLIEAARPYAEGRGVRLEVRTRKDLSTVLDLVAVKCGH